MMKKDKLYTVNKWNRPMFSPRKNIFAYGTPTLAPTSPTLNISQDSINSWISNYDGRLFPKSFYDEMESNLSEQTNNIKGIFSPLESKLSGYAKNGFTPTKSKANPFAEGSAGAQALAAAAPIIGGVAGDLIAGGLSSTAGSIVDTVGSAALSTAGTAIGGPVGGAIGAAAGKILGGVTNALVGTKVDQAKLNAANVGISAYNNFNSNAAYYDDIQGPASQAAVQNPYSGGLFKKGWARRKNEELRKRMTTAKDLAWRSVYNNVDNISKDQTNNALSQYFAYGGNLFGNNGDMGAIEYDFMDRYLTNYKDKSQQKETMTNLFAGTPSSLFADGGGIHIKKANEGKFTEQARSAGMGVQEYASHVLANKDRYPSSTVKRANFSRNASKWHAFGGDLQTNGADFSTGAIHVDAGGSHEMNPYDGVQLGTDSDLVPNLVEEGEVVFDDYVYSNRIPVDAETKKKFHLPKKKDISYADLAKKLEKEIQERPNDPISKAGFKAQMHELADQQERQKQEMEAARAREAFEALSPEEQTALMQRAAQEEALAQQAAQEQVAAEQQAAQQPSSEEVAMMQQQAQMTQPEVVEAQPMMAEGGHLFEEGGLKKNLYTTLKRATDSDFIKWLEDMGVTDTASIMDILNKEETSKEDWDALRNNAAFIKALEKENKGLAHSISQLGNNLGAYTPSSDSATFTDPDKGNWDKQLFSGWEGSKDDAWLELVEQWSKPEEEGGYGSNWRDKVRTFGNKQMEDAFKSTKAYQNTTEWLKKNSENMRKYLKTVLDTSTSQKAKNYALKFVNEDGTWKDSSNIPTYAQIFGEKGEGVRETLPGTYWHSVKEANRGNQNVNYLIHDDGTVELINGTTDGLTAAGTYNWQGDTDDMTVNYYTRPAAKADAEEEEEQRGVKPVHRSEALRYAGLFGPAVGLGLQMAGVGRPDTSRLDAALSSIGNTALADYKPLGNYLTYRPMDIWYEQNRMDANARATDRAILNNSAPVGTRMAGLLASGYNNQIANGELYRKALEYNDAKRAQVAEFNRGTDQFNADAYNRLSQFNANAINQDRHLKANMSMQAARDKMDADAGWYNSIYGNIGGLFKGLSDLGRENAQRNMIADMAAAGIFGNMNPDNFNPNGVLRWETDEEMKKNSTNKSAHGGSIKRKKGKRGLTY